MATEPRVADNPRASRYELWLGTTRAGFSATTELNRGDFGISTNIPMDGGGVVIGDRIQVFIEIEAVLNPPQPANP